ncbi:MAG: hypothetical protein ACJAR2_001946 [Ilumatobacter sp.]|jgi:hypothetical protein
MLVGFVVNLERSRPHQIDHKQERAQGGAVE